MVACTPDQLDAIAAVLTGVTDPEAAARALCGVLLAQHDSAIQGLRDGLNTLLLLFGGALVFIMHGGFAMLEAGAIRSKNAMNILLQTLIDAAASAIVWYLVGFGFAFGIGDHPNKFIGDAMFALARYETHYTGSGVGRWTDWFFQWAFAATAATVPAGSVAERCNWNAYLGYSCFIAGWVYPLVAHWVWCREGWLGYNTIDPIFNAGMMDFAGSGVIHMTGGLAGLCGAWLLGPRIGRFDAEGRPVDMPGHSAILVVLGTVMLWFGWYGFNPASILAIDTSALAAVAGRAAAMTTLAGAAGGISCLANGFRLHRGWDLCGLCNGVLCGLVAVTACCHVLEPWAALLVGALAGLWFDLLCWLLLKLRIDDPLSAGPMHFGCGMLGIFFTGLLAKEEYIQQYYKRSSGSLPYGAFYPGSDGKLLASQVVGILVIIGWVAGNMLPFFGILKYFGALRVSPQMEDIGLDRSKHGGSAYNMYIGTGGAVVHNSGGGAGDIEMDSPTTPKSGRVGWHAQQQQQQQQQQTGIKGAPKTTPGNDLIVRGGAANSSMTKVVPYDEDP